MASPSKASTPFDHFDHLLRSFMIIESGFCRKKSLRKDQTKSNYCMMKIISTEMSMTFKGFINFHNSSRPFKTPYISRFHVIVKTKQNHCSFSIPWTFPGFPWLWEPCKWISHSIFSHSWLQDMFKCHCKIYGTF